MGPGDRMAALLQWWWVVHSAGHAACLLCIEASPVLAGPEPTRVQESRGHTRVAWDPWQPALCGLVCRSGVLPEGLHAFCRISGPPPDWMDSRQCGHASVCLSLCR